MKTESFWREPNFPGEYQALGLVFGVWFPKGDNKSTTGWLLCDQGCSQIESSILGKDTREFIYSHRDLRSTKNYFNVYPRQVNGQLTFQVNMLHNKNASNWSDWLQTLEAHTDQFRIRGVIHGIKKDALVVHVKQNVKANKTPNFEFDVEVRGEVDSLGVGQFVEVFARRTGYVLEIESVELMEDVPSPSIAWAR